jgi:signal transduction histidine kinase
MIRWTPSWGDLASGLVVGCADDTRSSGLRDPADRVEALAGNLRVVSPAGSGTVVTAELPCERDRR